MEIVKRYNDIIFYKVLKMYDAKTCHCNKEMTMV